MEGADFGGIAQLVERFVRNEEARGSNPLTSTNLPSANLEDFQQMLVIDELADFVQSDVRRTLPLRRQNAFRRSAISPPI